MKNSASGSNHIHYEMLRRLPQHAKRSLLEHYNKIHWTGIYLKQWKEGILKPEGDKTLVSSYRPILPNCLKKITDYRLMWFLGKINFYWTIIWNLKKICLSICRLWWKITLIFGLTCWQYLPNQTLHKEYMEDLLN